MGYAVRCAEKLCFSHRLNKTFAATPPPLVVLANGGMAERNVSLRPRSGLQHIATRRKPVDRFRVLDRALVEGGSELFPRGEKRAY